MINPKQISVLAGLLAVHAEFAVVGGVAVNAHGFIRATLDLDIYIRPTVENAELVYRGLAAAGVDLQGIEASDFLLDYDNVRLGPREDQIDILPSIGAMSFDQVWGNRVEAKLGSLLVPFISKADLIANKQEVGRLRDLLDVEELSVLDDVLPEA